MKVVASALALLLSLSVSAETAQPDFWDRVLASLGWDKRAPLITRGNDALGVKGLGELWQVDRQGGSPAPVGFSVSLRSPLPASNGRTIYALTEDSIITVDLETAEVVTRVNLPPEDPPLRLLRQHERMVFALTAEGCLAAFNGLEWETRTCELSEIQRSELLDRAGVCGDLATGVRFETGPPPRTDILIRRGRLGKRLTDMPERRANYDPVFSTDCSRIYFVSRDRI